MMIPRLWTVPLLVACGIADRASIQTALDTINNDLQTLDNVVRNLPQGGLGQLFQVGAQAVPILSNATAIIEASELLSIEDALSLSTSTTALRLNTNLTINDFIAQKPFFDANNATAMILQGLIADKSSSVTLGQALISKFPDLSSVPNGTQSLVGAVFDLDAIFDRGITAFSASSTPAAPSSAPTISATVGPAVPSIVPVTIPDPAGVVTGQGSLNADGSCGCAVQCPVGSFMRSSLDLGFLS